jgi:hypothetical protein
MIIPLTRRARHGDIDVRFDLDSTHPEQPRERD